MKSTPKPNAAGLLASHNIENISMHTDNIEEGSAFCVTKYVKDYVDLAINKGAKFIISEDPVNDLPDNVSNIIVPDIREFIREACKILYPLKPKYMVGVTGTSGKTSIVDYYRQICANLGVKSASIGTMSIICSDKIIQDKITSKFLTSHTTSDTVTMHKILHNLAIEKVDYVSFEVSSHALHQDRIAGIKLDCAIFSNLSQDHLDYHKTMEEYKKAKLRIFEYYLADEGVAITSDKLYEGADVKATIQKWKRIIVGKSNSSDIKIENIKSNFVSQNLEFNCLGEEYKVRLDMIGTFQSMNILMAFGAAISTGFEAKEIVKILNKIKPVKGRLERITDLNHPFHIFTDFAHKPEALESCLSELKGLCKGKLLVLFGCGGNRDKLKRPIMGKIATDIADITIVSDDSPRFEDAASIRKDILEGAPGAIEIGDRAEAIKEAISMLGKDDMLLLAGKGHEDYQIFGDKKIHLDDTEEARKYI